MKKNMLLFLMLLVAACQQNNIKQELSQKINSNACEDVKSLVNQYANTVLPLIGGLIVEKVVPESVKNGLFCECATPTFQTFFVENYTEKELEEMLIDTKKRKSAMRKAILKNGKTILRCYKEKGLKGVKWIEKLVKNI